MKKQKKRQRDSSAKQASTFLLSKQGIASRKFPRTKSAFGVLKNRTNTPSKSFLKSTKKKLSTPKVQIITRVEEPLITVPNEVACVEESRNWSNIEVENVAAVANASVANASVAPVALPVAPPPVTAVTTPKSQTSARALSIGNQRSAFTPTILRQPAVSSTPIFKKDKKNVTVPDMSVLVSSKDFQQWLKHHVYSLSPARPLVESDLEQKLDNGVGMVDNRARSSDPVAQQLMMRTRRERGRQRRRRSREKQEVRDVFETMKVHLAAIELDAAATCAKEVAEVVVAKNEDIAVVEDGTEADNEEDSRGASWSSGGLYGWVQHFDIVHKAP